MIFILITFAIGLSLGVLLGAACLQAYTDRTGGNYARLINALYAQAHRSTNADELDRINAAIQFLSKNPGASDFAYRCFPNG